MSNKKWDIEKAREVFKDNGCELLEEIYIHCKTKMRYLCSCDSGEEAEITLDNFKQGQRCKKCMGKRIAERFKFSYEKVKEIFRKGGCRLISKTYKNNREKLDYECSCRRPAKITLHDFQSGRRCMKCFIERISGKNYWNYNFDKTDEERIIERSYPEYKKWRRDVYERDNFICIVCGDDRSGNFIAHHLESYDVNIDLRTVVSNGVTIDEDCHDLFHKIYGKGKNTTAQFEEFLEKYQEILIS